MLKRIKSFKQLINKLKQILKIYILNDREGANSKLHISLWKKLYCLKRGFLIDKYNLYNFKENDSKLFVSDIYFRLAHPKNGFYTHLIDSKAFLPIILNNYLQYLPSYYFTIYKPKILNHINNKYIDKSEFLGELNSLLEQKRTIILKPLAWWEGKGFVLLSKNDNTITYNNENISIKDLNLKLSCLDNYICTEHILNAGYIQKIFPHSLNTIRVLTIWDYEENKPFIAMAVHKFGINPKITIDTGVTSEIELKTGTLTKARWHVKDCVLESSDFHPFSNSLVNGVKIDNWEFIISILMEIAYKMPFLPYMGFDIAITEDSFSIIEINSNTDLDLLQRHRPLLTDDKIRKFFDQYKDQKPEKWFYKK